MFSIPRQSRLSRTTSGGLQITAAKRYQKPILRRGTRTPSFQDLGPEARRAAQVSPRAAGLSRTPYARPSPVTVLARGFAPLPLSPGTGRSG
ncbi:hypothetical protein GCM10010266_56130 [Streptomyces griseomycini]|nr:hypothetical protein GCM10010266_56130 [Streptomyces griseomycini]GGR42517.1 hypothetical protein GCM10015536_55600 [Streptomyces griseomycini]